MRGKAFVPFMLKRGDGSTLSLDFAQMGGLDSRFTFTRNSIATFINSSGLVEQVSAAPSNDPTKARFDYNPTTLAARGLLIEASATNICTRSEDLANAVWVVDNGSATNPSVSVVSQAAPNGGSSVNRITFNKTGGTFSRIRQTLVGTSGATYTFSVWMKANTANGAAATQNVGLRIGADTGGFNCAVTTTWRRFSYSYALSGTDASAQIMLWDNIAGNDETADVLVWGAQLEAGSDASSYIPTGLSTVQRAAESCSMTGTNFSSWYNQTEGTIYVDQVVTSTGGSNQAAATLQQSSTQYLTIGQNSSGAGGSSSAFYIRDTTDQAVLNSSLTIALGSIIKSCGAYKVNSIAFSANGLATITDTSSTVPTPTELRLSNVGTVASSRSIRRIVYWPTRLPDATLQSLTT